MSPGNTAKISSAFKSATSVPTRKAAAKASSPMFTDIAIATAKIAASTRMDTTSADTAQSSSRFFMILPMAFRGRLSTNLTSRGRLCGASWEAT
jgi:hypothetical protein